MAARDSKCNWNDLGTKIVATKAAIHHNGVSIETASPDPRLRVFTGIKGIGNEFNTFCERACMNTLNCKSYALKWVDFANG